MVRYWIQALRPLAHFNIAVPLLFGQALAFATCREFGFRALIGVQILGLVDHAFIILNNDVADAVTDQKNQTYNVYSGGSRVVAEGRLSLSGLKRAVIAALTANVLLTAAVAGWLRVPWLLLIQASGLLLTWAYDRKPLLRSYRGHGEILQGFGVGVVLPVLGFHAQCPASGLPWLPLLGSFTLALAGHITTALSDTPSDRASDKRTFSVRYGELAARVVSMLLIVAAGLITFSWASSARAWLCLVALLPLVANLHLVRFADAINRRHCGRFMTVNLTASMLLFIAWSVLLVTTPEAVL